MRITKQVKYTITLDDGEINDAIQEYIAKHSDYDPNDYSDVECNVTGGYNVSAEVSFEGEESE